MNGIRRKKCPLCGGEIIISSLYQISHDYKLTKAGKMSKRYTVTDAGTEEALIAACACGANWEVGDFGISDEGFFIDYKYEKE